MRIARQPSVASSASADVWPNITGKVTNVGLNFSETESVGSTWGTKEGWWGGSNDDNYKTTLNFDASRSSSVYGESSIVQPSSVRLLACARRLYRLEALSWSDQPRGAESRCGLRLRCILVERNLQQVHDGAAAFTSTLALHQALMQGRKRIDGGCTVDDFP